MCTRQQETHFAAQLSQSQRSSNGVCVCVCEVTKDRYGRMWMDGENCWSKILRKRLAAGNVLSALSALNASPAAMRPQDRVVWLFSTFSPDTHTHTRNMQASYTIIEKRTYAICLPVAVFWGEEIECRIDVCLPWKGKEGSVVRVSHRPPQPIRDDAERQREEFVVIAIRHYRRGPRHLR